MQQFTRSYTLAGNKTTGNTVEAQNGNLLASVVVGKKQYNIWFPAGAQIDRAITFNVHEVGDTFVAASDSKTTWGELLEGKELKAKADELKISVDAAKDTPIFAEGDTVVRQKETIEWVGFAPEATKTEDEELSTFAKKAKILADLGVKLSM